MFHKSRTNTDRLYRQFASTLCVYYKNYTQMRQCVCLSIFLRFVVCLFFVRPYERNKCSLCFTLYWFCRLFYSQHTAYFHTCWWPFEFGFYSNALHFTFIRSNLLLLWLESMQSEFKVFFASPIKRTENSKNRNQYERRNNFYDISFVNKWMCESSSHRSKQWRMIGFMSIFRRFIPDFTNFALYCFFSRIFVFAFNKKSTNKMIVNKTLVTKIFCQLRMAVRDVGMNKKSNQKKNNKINNLETWIGFYLVLFLLILHSNPNCIILRKEYF